MNRNAMMYAAVACGAFLLGCGNGGTDDAMVDDQPAPPAAEPSPLAGFAGTWAMRVLSESGDSLASYELDATDTRDGWMIRFPGRDPIPMRVVDAGGDSVVTEAGPYESILRAGVQVTTRAVVHRQGDQLTGSTRAVYAGAGADSVANLRSDGRRIR
jgi:hypothetical protein